MDLLSLVTFGCSKSLGDIILMLPGAASISNLMAGPFQHRNIPQSTSEIELAYRKVRPVTLASLKFTTSQHYLSTSLTANLGTMVVIQDLQSCQEMKMQWAKRANPGKSLSNSILAPQVTTTGRAEVSPLVRFHVEIKI